MHRLGYLGSLAMLVVAAGFARSGDDDKTARGILAKAITAHGGEEKLAKIKAITRKGAGTLHLDNNKLDYTAEWLIQGTTQEKFVVDVNFNGMSIKVTKIINGDKGWQKIGDGQAAPLSKEEQEEALDDLYAGNLQMLAPLQDKAFKLAPLGEVKVDGKDALGISVSSKGHRDVNLYFDKTTHLLVKSETRAREKGVEINLEMLFDQYKMVDGVQEAFKITILRDGKTYVEGNLTEVLLHTQKLDDSNFQQP
jgi:hypothetical protein